MSSKGARARDHSVQSVDRAVSVMQVLAARGPCGLTEISAELGIHKTTVFRLLATLESRGLVEQHSERGRYRIGYPVVELAAGASQVNDLSLLSRSVCQELAVEVGDTVSVAIADGGEAVCIDRTMGAAAIASMDWAGRRSPMHASSTGKIFLAHMSLSAVADMSADGLKEWTPHTIVDPDRLAEELAEVRKRGYATTSEEHEIGLAAIAAPIRALGGRVIGAVSLSGPTFRINDDTVAGLAEQVVAAGDRISWRRGYVKHG